MNIPAYLLGLSLVSAAAYAWAGTKGVVALCVLLVACAVISAMQSTNALMVVGYGLAFGSPFAIGAIVLGAFAGSLFRKGSWALAPLMFLPFIYFIWHTGSVERKEVDEGRMASQFVREHPGIATLVGGPVEAQLVSKTTYADKSRGKLEFRIEAGSSLYAIVTVDRHSGEPKMALACLTATYMGHRDVQRGDCDQGVVPLDGSTAVVVENLPGAQSNAFSSRGTSLAKAGQRAFLPRIPENAQVHAIGVYEAEGTPPPQSQARPPGRVLVNLPYSKKPLVLVLTSHESVQWSVVNQGRDIVAVLLSSYQPSNVAGVYGEITVIGNLSAHEVDSSDFVRLKNLIVQNTRLPTVQFQGARRASSFTVPTE